MAEGGIVTRDFLTVKGKTFGGSAETFGYWTGPDNITTNVPPASGGSSESRDFIGGGTLLEVPPIIDAIGVDARSITIGLDHISDAAGSPMDAVFGNNIRVARVELHRGFLDPATWELVAEPSLIFEGRVDGASVDDAEAGGTGGLSLEAVSGAIDLTKTNPAMESDEQQKLRSGDRMRQYGDTVADVWWGQTKD
jgi:hypothetical protein